MGRVLIHNGDYDKICKNTESIKNHIAAFVVLKELDRCTSAYSNNGNVTSFNVNEVFSDISDIESSFLPQEKISIVNYIVIGALLSATREKDINRMTLDKSLEHVSQMSNAKFHLVSIIMQAQNLLQKEISMELFRTTESWMS